MKESEIHTGEFCSADFCTAEQPGERTMFPGPVEEKHGFWEWIRKTFFKEWYE